MTPTVPAPQVDTLGKLLSRIEEIPVMELMLFITLTACVFLLVAIQMKKDKLDLRYLILDDNNRKPSIHKLGQVLALLVSTWGFVYEIEHGTFTETYLTVYMGIWAGAGAVNKYLDTKGQASAQSSSTTTTTSSITGGQNGNTP